jgi:hypothetical protein
MKLSHSIWCVPSLLVFLLGIAMMRWGGNVGGFLFLPATLASGTLSHSWSVSSDSITAFKLAQAWLGAIATALVLLHRRSGGGGMRPADKCCLGFACGALVFCLLNGLQQHRDGPFPVSFGCPFTYWQATPLDHLTANLAVFPDEQEHELFIPCALVGDVAVGVVFSICIGILARRFRRPKMW